MVTPNADSYALAEEQQNRYLFKATEKPHSLNPWPSTFYVHLRDNFRISTWLLLGAAIQTLLYALTPYALLLPALLLAARSVNPLLVVFGLKRNKLLDGTIQGKFAVRFPDSDERPNGEEEVCVIILGARSNHPLGLFAPGFKEMGDLFGRMFAEMDADPEKHGYLGAASFIDAADRKTANGTATMVYFKDAASLYKFAHSRMHRDAWEWWNKTYPTHPYLSIMHELYICDKSRWESILINYHPTMLSATRAKLPRSAEHPDGAWVRPLVDASQGAMKTHKGRLGRTDGEDNDKLGEEPYGPAVVVGQT